MHKFGNFKTPWQKEATSLWKRHLQSFRNPLTVQQLVSGEMSTPFLLCSTACLEKWRMKEANILFHGTMMGCPSQYIIRKNLRPQSWLVTLETRLDTSHFSANLIFIGSIGYLPQRRGLLVCEFGSFAVTTNQLSNVVFPAWFHSQTRISRLCVTRHIYANLYRELENNLPVGSPKSSENVPTPRSNLRLRIQLL